MAVKEYPEILSGMCQYDNTIQKTKLEEQFNVSVDFFLLTLAKCIKAIFMSQPSDI